MRILIAGRTAPDAPSGEGRYLGRVRDLLAEDHDVDVVLGKSAAPGLSGRVRSRVGLELAVRRRASSFGPDVVVAFAPEVPSGLARTVGVLGPLAVRAESGLDRFALRVRTARSEGRDAILVPTRIAAQRRPANQPQVFHPGPGPAFGASPATPPDDGTVRIVQLGSLRADKGAHLTVEATHSLTRERGRVEVHLVGREGEAGYVARLKRRGRDLDLRFHPETAPAAEIAALLARSHLLSAPATADGTWGFAVAEAMRMGLPVVHSNIGDHRELVGAAGVEVQAGDVKQLGAAFRKLLRDREHWADRATACREEAEARYGDEDAIRARLTRLLEA